MVALSFKSQSSEIPKASAASYDPKVVLEKAFVHLTPNYSREDLLELEQSVSSFQIV